MIDCNYSSKYVNGSQKVVCITKDTSSFDKKKTFTVTLYSMLYSLRISILTSFGCLALYVSPFFTTSSSTSNGPAAYAHSYKCTYFTVRWMLAISTVSSTGIGKRSQYFCSIDFAFIAFTIRI